MQDSVNDKISITDNKVINTLENYTDFRLKIHMQLHSASKPQITVA